MEIACCIALKDPQVHNHLAPIARHPAVRRLWIVRARASRYGTLPHSETIETPGRFRPARWLRMLAACRRLARRPQMRGFVSFNPFPYGLIAMAAARRRGLPVHFGFIGTDWNAHAAGAAGRFLLPLVRRADFVTLSSRSVARSAAERGIDPARTAVLPHTLDLERFPVADPDAVGHDCIFVGALKAGKRVDLILRAWAAVVASRPTARLLIVGDGPAGPDLQRLAAELGLDQSVEFAGHRDDVAPFLAAARILLLASEAEGLPYALVEGLCTGLVPICSAVGGIPEVVRDGETGLLFSPGRAGELAERIGRLLDDRALWAALRANVLALRGAFAHERATEVWDPWLRRLSGSEANDART